MKILFQCPCCSCFCFLTKDSKSKEAEGKEDWEQWVAVPLFGFRLCKKANASIYGFILLKFLKIIQVYVTFLSFSMPFLCEMPHLRLLLLNRCKKKNHTVWAEFGKSEFNMCWCISRGRWCFWSPSKLCISCVEDPVGSLIHAYSSFIKSFSCQEFRKQHCDEGKENKMCNNYWNCLLKTFKATTCIRHEGFICPISHNSKPFCL